MRQARNVYVQDRNLASRIQEWSARNEEDIVYSSRELADVNLRVNRLAADNEHIESNSRRIDSLNSQQRKLEKRVGSTREELRELINQRTMASAGGGPQTRFDLPSFENLPNERPLRFLTGLLDYFERAFKHVLKQVLKGAASDWWEYVSDCVYSIRDFQERFIDRFWGRQRQAHIRDTLEYGFYEAQGNLSRSKYVLRSYNQVCILSDALREVEIVD